ncbi:hypothetical protein W02_09650 [Nitrospira sp. KM1]|uniref:hypothetical protein n=1 Tax=Nitrospira sp. KM1 TaxID=1936990 RepID=UPI0013A7501E|nr:hypothetical protein [Nitrospira sp. KM1]BCA53825.1 hypothetical protein W02_09650 [Nitrospira sp. KM1]
MKTTAHAFTIKRTILAMAMMMTAASIPSTASAESSSTGHRLLLKSAVENAAFTEVTLPIFEGRRGNETVWFVVTESSDRQDAERRGVHYSPKMANGKGTLAVQQVAMRDGIVRVLGSVDFSPERVVIPSATGFPPNEATPGAIGEALYTPLIELPNGIVLNAPQIKNASGEHDRLIRIDLEKRTATFRMTDGFFEGRRVHYTSFNASDPAVAALEAANYTPNLKALPNKGSNSPSSALTGLAPIVNGPTGKQNPQRQGLSSTLLGEGDPLNIVQEIPAGKRALAYSPMWDVHASVWTQRPMPVNNSLLQTDFNAVARLGMAGRISGPEGKPWGSIGVIVNCPIISIEE